MGIQRNAGDELFAGARAGSALAGAAAAIGLSAGRHGDLALKTTKVSKDFVSECGGSGGSERSWFVPVQLDRSEGKRRVGPPLNKQLRVTKSAPHLPPISHAQFQRAWRGGKCPAAGSECPFQAKRQRSAIFPPLHGFRPLPHLRHGTNRTAWNRPGDARPAARGPVDRRDRTRPHGGPAQSWERGVGRIHGSSLGSALPAMQSPNPALPHVSRRHARQLCGRCAGFPGWMQPRQG